MGCGHFLSGDGRAEDSDTILTPIRILWPDGREVATNYLPTLKARIQGESLFGKTLRR